MGRARKRRAVDYLEREFDAVLPAQLIRPGGPLGVQPERRLVLAVMEDAVHLYLRNPQGAEDVAVWMDTDDRSWPYSFRNCCDVLGLDPDAVREGVRRQRPRRVPAAA